jgi:hypothetical protein
MLIRLGICNSRLVASVDEFGLVLLVADCPLSAVSFPVEAPVIVVDRLNLRGDGDGAIHTAFQLIFGNAIRQRPSASTSLRLCNCATGCLSLLLYIEVHPLLHPTLCVRLRLTQKGMFFLEACHCSPLLSIMCSSRVVSDS